ncbi:MAG: HAD family hydrolase [Intestinibacillus sp.]
MPSANARFKGCIFDLDGTLLYTLPTIHYYCNRSLAHFGLHSITLQECQDLCRLSIAHFYQRLLQLGGCPEDAVPSLHPLIRDYDCESYLQDFTYLTEPYPGISETLRTLRARGIRTGVLTNKPNEIAQSLVRSFFSELIEVCVGQTPESISKPDPRSMDGICQGLSLSSGELVYVGDTDVDMRTAINTGTFAVAAAWGYQPRQTLEAFRPGFIADAPQDILTLF